MNFKEDNLLAEVLNGLFKIYEKQVPDVKLISSAMLSEKIIENKNEIVNDHIAFRTLGLANLGIQSFEKIFMYHGYVKKEYYYFKTKKLNAYWYSHKNQEYPRIFISELRVQDLSLISRKIINKYTNHITEDPIESICLDNPREVLNFFIKPLWSIPTLADYLSLHDESEYASWVIYNRYYLNHYTISVHALKKGWNTIFEFNYFLEKTGIILNDSGGVIKISEDGLLLQSSSVAQSLVVEFIDGKKHKISGSYVEFAERKVLPEFTYLASEQVKNIHRRDGFEAANADKIFESTYSTQFKNKKK